VKRLRAGYSAEKQMLHLIYGFSQAGNSASGIFPMHHAFACGSVQNRGGLNQSGSGRIGILLLDSGAHILDYVFDSGAHITVTGSVSQTLFVPFHS
jgi:hypothetical protein